MGVINLNKAYCLVHKKVTGNRNIKFVETKGERTMMKSICDISPHVKTKFISNNIPWFEKTNKLKKVSN